jgi:hypothetical protein
VCPAVLERRPSFAPGSTIHKDASAAGQKTPINPTVSSSIASNKRAYKGRNVIERSVCRLKDFRRIATRYDKLAQNCRLAGPYQRVCVLFLPRQDRQQALERLRPRRPDSAKFRRFQKVIAFTPTSTHTAATLIRRSAWPRMNSTSGSSGTETTQKVFVGIVLARWRKCREKAIVI